MCVYRGIGVQGTSKLVCHEKHPFYNKPLQSPVRPRERFWNENGIRPCGFVMFELCKLRAGHRTFPCASVSLPQTKGDSPRGARGQGSCVPERTGLCQRLPSRPSGILGPGKLRAGGGEAAPRTRPGCWAALPAFEVSGAAAGWPARVTCARAGVSPTAGGCVGSGGGGGGGCSSRRGLPRPLASALPPAPLPRAADRPAAAPRRASAASMGDKKSPTR